LIIIREEAANPASFFDPLILTSIIHSLQAKEVPMTEQAERGKHFFKVKDEAGNEWLCPFDALKKVKDANQAELDDCVEKDVVTRYAGDIEAER
jgi:hypothetical protein